MKNNDTHQLMTDLEEWVGVIDNDEKISMAQFILWAKRNLPDLLEYVGALELIADNAYALWQETTLEDLKSVRTTLGVNLFSLHSAMKAANYHVPDKKKPNDQPPTTKHQL